MIRPLLLALAPLTLAACLTGTPATPDGGVADSALPDGRTARHDGGPPQSEDGARTGDGGLPGLDAVADGARPSLDASSAVDGAFVVDGGSASRCMETSAAVTCTSRTYTFAADAGSARVVYYQVPLGAPPASGWPTVFMFQGSFISAEYTFAASSVEDYGLYYQTELVKNLLDAGYAVLAPEALDGGTSYWETNIAPYASSWSGCADDLLVKEMLAAVKAGTFGPLDATRLYATGISSGGYMTSRMAVSYPGTFKALAIESGSYATCLSGESAVTGGLCTVPALPASHPPTLLLHGTLDTTIVPEWTVTAYVTALKAASIPESEIDDANSGHQWIPEAPAAVLAWFQKYP